MSSKKTKYYTGEEINKLLIKLENLGPDDKYTPRAVRDEMDYIRGILNRVTGKNKQRKSKGGKVYSNTIRKPRT